MDDATYDQRSEDSGEKAKRPGFPVEPRRLIAILSAHRRVLGLTFGIASLVALIAFFFLPETFEAEAVLLYEGSPVLDADGIPPTPTAFIDSALVPSRLAEIRERLGWDISLEELGTELSAELQSETSVRLAASGRSAESTYALATTTLDLFLEHQTAFNMKELERLTARNKASLARAKEQRQQAQSAFEEFREKSGRPDLLNEKAQLLSRAAELRARQDEAEVEIAAQQALITELEQVQAELPRQVVSSATRSSAIEGPLAQARSDLAEARATLSDQHPRVLALRERVARLKAQRGSGSSGITEQTLSMNPARATVDQQLAGARAALAAAQERKSALEVLLADVKREATALSPEEGEARRILGDLSAAVARVEELVVREAQLRDAAFTPINRFKLLSPPVLPEHSQRSGKQVIAVALMPLIATLICALIMLIRNLSELTVRAPSEVAWWGNGPVLGTTIWPRRPDALQAFVDELEDQGMHAAGRTLVIPVTETEREHACSFALKLADAPWLAAAVLDIDERAKASSSGFADAPSALPLVTPTPYVRPRRLASDASPSGPAASGPPGAANRPPRKKTVIGLPAVGQPSASSESSPSSIPNKPSPSGSPSGPQAFQRKRGARATVRMVVPTPGSAAANDSSPPRAGSQEEAFLLTRPVPTRSSAEEPRVGPAVLLGHETPHGNAPNAVMRAAIRLLGDGDEELHEPRRSEPPTARDAAEVTGVALAWNGPLSGPVLRRAARLAHRVVVVVSSGASAVDLTRVQARLGRGDGVGYVLINSEDRYAEHHDRVGPVDEFWQGKPKAEG